MHISLLVVVVAYQEAEIHPSAATQYLKPLTLDLRVLPHLYSLELEVSTDIALLCQANWAQLEYYDSFSYFPSVDDPECAHLLELFPDDPCKYWSFACVMHCFIFGF